MKTASFCTLGCKVNQYETEAIRELFEKDGIRTVPFGERADYTVINTCSVTAMSDRKSRQMIRRARKASPEAKIAVMGCYSQTAPDDVLKLGEADLVLGTKDKASVLELLKNMEPGVKLNAVSDIRENRAYEELSVKSASRGMTRAYIKIQDGCSQFCSYCIIPYARGPVRSRDEDEIVAEAETLASAGCREIVLTGIHVAAYGEDRVTGENTALERLLSRLDAIDDIRRIRLSSIEPMTLSAGFVNKIKGCKKLCPHFHISLQSGCDETLRRMNRHYKTEQYEQIVLGLREAFPGCAVTTDIMTGFAGETDEEFGETLRFIESIKFADAHIFKYSRRRGTPAAKRPDQVAPEVKDARAKAVAEIVHRSRDEFLEAHIGKETEVLFETVTDNGLYEGKTADYVTVRVPSGEDLCGKFRKVVPEYRKNGIIFGKTVD